MSKNYGMDAGNEAMSTSDFSSRLRPKAGDRVRFHFLTDGNDPWLVATRFHRVGDGMSARNIVCLNALTFGDEQCQICDTGDTTRRKMFGVWVLVEYILHPQDNPDDEGENWEQKTLKYKGDDGQEKTRTVFMEEFASAEGPGEAKLLHIPAGRQGVWWNQFHKAFMESLDLRKHFYELYRVGSGRDDTDWTLTTLKEDELDKAILERADIQALTNVEDVFRAGLSQMSTNNSPLGTDSVDGEEEPEAMPTPANPTPEAAESAADLI